MLEGESWRDVLVNAADHARTTTDICALLKSGYPRQSAAYVKIAGVRTNYTIPDVTSIALGGGSVVRQEDGRTLVGPESVGWRLKNDAISYGGDILTVRQFLDRAYNTDIVRLMIW